MSSPLVFFYPTRLPAILSAALIAGAYPGAELEAVHGSDLCEAVRNFYNSIHARRVFLIGIDIVESSLHCLRDLASRAGRVTIISFQRLERAGIAGLRGLEVVEAGSGEDLINKTFQLVSETNPYSREALTSLYTVLRAAIGNARALRGRWYVDCSSETSMCIAGAENIVVYGEMPAKDVARLIGENGVKVCSNRDYCEHLHRALKKDYCLYVASIRAASFIDKAVGKGTGHPPMPRIDCGEPLRIVYSGSYAAVFQLDPTYPTSRAARYLASELVGKEYLVLVFRQQDGTVYFTLTVTKDLERLLESLGARARIANAVDRALGALGAVGPWYYKSGSISVEKLLRNFRGSSPEQILRNIVMSLDRTITSAVRTVEESI